MNEMETPTLLPVVLELFDGSGTAPSSGAAPGSGPPGGYGAAPGGRQSTGQTGDGRTGALPAPPGPPTENRLGAVPPPGAVPPSALEQLHRQRARIGQGQAEAQLRAWSDQAEQAKTLYPSFDLGREAQNRDFRSMLRAGVPVRQAFEVVHMDEIMATAAAMQAQATERAVTANIKAKGTRPQENGAGAASGFTVKDDVSRLTPKDRAEMARRAARGEVITF